MNRLEVEPVGGAGLQIDQDVLRHRVGVGEPQVMQLAEGDDRPFDCRLSKRLLKCRILQPGRQRASREKWQDEDTLSLDPNGSTAEAPVDSALPLLPIPLPQDPNAGI